MRMTLASSSMWGLRKTGMVLRQKVRMETRMAKMEVREIICTATINVSFSLSASGM